MDSYQILENYKAINGIKKGDIIFGLTQDYKKWNEKEVKDSNDNIAKLIEKWVENGSKSIEPYLLISCLALKSAMYEAGIDIDINSFKFNDAIIDYKYPESDKVNTESNKMEYLRKALELEREKYSDQSAEKTLIDNLLKRLKVRQESYLNHDTEEEAPLVENSIIIALSKILLDFYEKSGMDIQQLESVRQPRKIQVAPLIDIWSIMQ